MRDEGSAAVEFTTPPNTTAIRGNGVAIGRRAGGAPVHGIIVERVRDPDAVDLAGEAGHAKEHDIDGRVSGQLRGLRVADQQVAANRAGGLFGGVVPIDEIALREDAGVLHDPNDALDLALHCGTGHCVSRGHGEDVADLETGARKHVIGRGEREDFSSMHEVLHGLFSPDFWKPGRRKPPPVDYPYGRALTRLPYSSACRGIRWPRRRSPCAPSSRRRRPRSPAWSRSTRPPDPRGSSTRPCRSGPDRRRGTRR